MRLTRRNTVFLVVVASLFAAATLVVTRCVETIFADGEGSFEYAREWGRELSRFDDPESAKVRFTDVASRRFPDGTWVFGISADSHGSWRGGTIVLKDSTGRIRAFHGHVCGPAPGFLEGAFDSPNSLAELYDRQSSLMTWVEGEYEIPQ